VRIVITLELPPEADGRISKRTLRQVFETSAHHGSLHRVLETMLDQADPRIGRKGTVPMYITIPPPTIKIYRSEEVGE